MHGDEVCRTLAAERADTRVLMLTAAGTASTTASTGLALGADDYLPKPFDFAELVARIRALARRTRPRAAAGAGHGDLTLDPPAAWRRAPAGGWTSARRISRVLEYLLAADGRSYRPRNCSNGSGTRRRPVHHHGR